MLAYSLSRSKDSIINKFNVIQKIKEHFNYKLENKMRFFDIANHITDFISLDYIKRGKMDTFYGINELKSKIITFITNEINDNMFLELLNIARTQLFEMRNLDLTIGNEFIFITKLKGKNK